MPYYTQMGTTSKDFNNDIGQAELRQSVKFSTEFTLTIKIDLDKDKSDKFSLKIIFENAFNEAHYDPYIKFQFNFLSFSSQVKIRNIVIDQAM